MKKGNLVNTVEISPEIAKVNTYKGRKEAWKISTRLRSRMIIRSICYLKTRGESRASKGDKRRWPSTTMCREWKKRAKVRRLTSFKKFICVRERERERERENLVFDSLYFILSQWRDLRIRVMWWNLGVLVTARAAELRTRLRRFVCVAGRLSRRELQ